MSDYIDIHRHAREKVIVLKHKILAIRSSCDLPIIVMEGVDDVGPYEVWIGRLCPTLEFHPLPAKGKKKLLEYRDHLGKHRSSDETDIFFIMDRDFDAYQGSEPGRDLFCTRSYSFENLLVSNDVLKSILLDEFRFHGLPAETAKILEIFEKVHTDFSSKMHDANCYIYSCISRGGGKKGVEEKINKYVEIKLEYVEKIYEICDLPNLIPSECVISIVPEADAFFSSGNKKLLQRGKFHLSFFKKWLEVLADMRRNGGGTIQKDSEIKFTLAAITPRSLASRSSVPDGLSDFVQYISEACNSKCT